ncbi:MAG TPA: PQQ-binding-like beta-propeller repeat protein [Pararhizobium sp.]|nr:PQQ-binding-like beta-propeller repeat protein [Pararhizobium sp.]
MPMNFPAILQTTRARHRSRRHAVGIGALAALGLAISAPAAFAAPPGGGDVGALGAKLYKQQGCAGCHGANGGGGIGKKLQNQPDLQNANHVIDQIVHGGGGMPPFGKKLSNDQIATIATYIRTNFGNSFGKVTAEQVAAVKSGKQASSGASKQMAVGAPAKNVAQPTTEGPSQKELDQAASATDSWLMYNKGYRGHRYSSLDQINDNNASKLEPVCIAQLGAISTVQASPIVYDGLVYVTTQHNTYALDATNCHQVWEYTYKPKGPEPFNTNRGVAIAGGRVFRGTTDGHMIALDAKTGKLLWNIRPVDSSKGYFLSAMPIVWHNELIMGTAGADWGAPAKLFAFDVKDGHTLWSLSEIKESTFGGAKAASTGGGSNWTSFALDEKTGTLYVPVGNPAPDFAPQYRPGKNLYTNSVLVVDAKTGKIDRYYQQITNDGLDRDTAAAPIIFNLPKDQVEANATPYSATVKPKDVNFAEAPPKKASDSNTGSIKNNDPSGTNTSSNTAGQANASNPLYMAVANKAGHLFLYNDDAQKLVYRVPVTTIENARSNPTTKGTHVCPGINGGVEWYGPAYDKTDHQLYVGSVDWCSTFTLGEIRYTPGQFFFAGTFQFDPVKQGKGWISAFDAGTGKLIWKYKSDTPVVAGVTPTAGNVVFSGELNGDFIVLDKKTGKKLYSFYTGGPVGSGISTYEIKGRQYVVLASGNESRTWTPDITPAATVVIFALPQESGSAGKG